MKWIWNVEHEKLMQNTETQNFEINILELRVTWNLEGSIDQEPRTYKLTKTNI